MLDLIIKNAIVLTMAGKGVGLIEDGAVGIKDDTIVVVDDSVTVSKNYKAEREIDAKGKVVLPGFINVHCHSYYGVMCRGILTDLEFFLEEGLAGYTDTLDIEKGIAGSKAHILEGIKHGTTTFGDMGSNYDMIAKVHDEFGTRARVCEYIRELPWNISDMLEGDYKFDRKYAEAGIKAMMNLLNTYGVDPENRISAMVCFQALDYISEELIIELREIARSHNAMIHTHLSQSPFEVEQAIKRFGMRPVDVFEKLGILNENTLAAHLVYNTPEENKKTAESGVKMACCPSSWGEVGVVPPVAQFLDAGGIVGIGSDEAAYTGVNPAQDMKISYILSNIDAYTNKKNFITMSTALRLQTIEAAKALGIGNVVGSLEPGKKADVIIINPDVINLTPVLLSPLTNIPQNIVSTATGNEVETVIIDGKIIMEDFEIKTFDERKVIDDAQKLGQEAAEDAAAYFKKLKKSEVLDRQRWFKEK